MPFRLILLYNTRRSVGSSEENRKAFAKFNRFMSNIDFFRISMLIIMIINICKSLFIQIKPKIRLLI